MRCGGMILGLALLLIGTAAWAQRAESGGGAEQKHEHVMRMLEDSTMMWLMLEHIATHRTYRQEMVRQMVRQADRDSSFREDMLRMLLNDAELNQTLQRMLERGRGEWDRIQQQEGRRDVPHEMHHDTTRTDTTGTREREREREDEHRH